MVRYQLIERILRQIYGGQPSEDSNITTGLVNQWVNDGIALAAKQCYKEALTIDGIGYLNNSFYTTFSGITISNDSMLNQTYKATLPQVPVGVGRNEGINSVRFVDSVGNTSLSATILTANESAFFDRMRQIPNTVIVIPEGNLIRMKSTIQLWNYTITIVLVSGGDSTDMNSIVNVPDDYIPVIIEYCKAQLLLERAQPQDKENDGEDNK